MSDYIIFENWPDIEGYYENKNNPFDDMTLEEKYAEYIRMKNENPKVTDEELSRRVGKSVFYFQGIKLRIRRKICEKRLLRSL